MKSSVKKIDVMTRLAYESDAQGFICLPVYECEHHLLITHELFVSQCIDINFEGIKDTLKEINEWVREERVSFIPLSMIVSGEWDKTYGDDGIGLYYGKSIIVVISDNKER